MARLRHCITTRGPAHPVDTMYTLDERTRRSALEFVLPDLDESVDSAIDAENLRAIQAIYFVCMLDEMRLFQVVERIVALFREGLLPLGRGPAREFLSNYDRWSAERMSATDRRDFYARAFGAPGGTSDSEPNRDFDRLWLRFLSAIATLMDQIRQTPLVDAPSALSASQEAARKSGRDLATNLAHHGFGITYFAASELAQTVVELRNVLRDTELRAAFGARDIWQLIDRITVEHLGGAHDTARYRARSKAGAVIIRWIANNGSRLASASDDVVDAKQLAGPSAQPVPRGHNPAVDPTDQDLVDACEQWLTVGGAQDDSIEHRGNDRQRRS